MYEQKNLSTHIKYTLIQQRLGFWGLVLLGRRENSFVINKITIQILIIFLQNWLMFKRIIISIVIFFGVITFAQSETSWIKKKDKNEEVKKVEKKASSWIKKKKK